MMVMNLLPIANPLQRIAVFWKLSLVFKKSGWFTHGLKMCFVFWFDGNGRRRNAALMT
jgi:hypothetical protein